MKVVILTHSYDRHYFFCNRVIEKTNVVGVITGGKPVNRSCPETMRRKLRRSEILYTLRNKARMPNNLHYLGARTREEVNGIIRSSLSWLAHVILRDLVTT